LGTCPKFPAEKFQLENRCLHFHSLDGKRRVGSSTHSSPSPQE